MKVAYLNQDPGIQPGKRKGASVHVEAMRRAFRAVGAEVVEVDSTDPQIARSALWRSFVEGGLDLLYERYALNRFTGWRFSREHGIPFVLEVNSPLAEEDALYREGQRSSLDRARESRMFQSATRVLAVSSQVAEYCVERGARPERVLVRPNAVDPERFCPRSADDPLRSELVPAGRLALGFHGRLRPWHNFSMLVDVLAGLLERGLPMHLLVLGEGPFERELAGRIPEEHTTLMGWRPHDETARVVACFDALPLTYAPDRPCYFSPLKLLEAMAAGVVPLVPDMGDLPSSVIHGQRGYVYPAGSSAALVEQLAELVREPQLRARMASNARAFATTRTWDSIAEEVLEQVADGAVR